MTVNLMATATLNTKPFKAGLQELSRGVAALGTVSKASTKDISSQIAAHEEASRAARRTAQAVNAGYGAQARGAKAAAKTIADYQTLQREGVQIADRIANAYRTLPKVEAAAEAARLKSAQARLNYIRAMDQGIEGPALDPYLNKRNAATVSLAKAQQSLEASNNRLAASQLAATTSTGNMTRALSGQRYLMHDMSRQAAQAAVVMAAFPIAAIAAASAWERDFAAVVRTSNLKDDLEGNKRQVEALRDSLVSMAQTMPASFGDVTQAATLANQMGIAAKDTAEFTRAAIMFAETSGVSVDITATAFGRLKSLVSDVGTDFMGLSDSILKVGVNSVATEDEIINVTTQISSIAAQAGFSSREMIGLSGALASVRVPPELSRGLITRTFGQIDKAVAKGGTSLDTLARISGRTSEQFKAQWGTAAAGQLFTDFIKGLNKAGNTAREEIESLGITSVRDVPVLLRLANAADSNGQVGGLLSQTMYDAKNAAGETQAQYQIMAETVVGKLKILGNNVVAFFDAVGQSSLGPFGNLLDNITEGIRNFTRSLDKPAKLLGMFELPWTNAEALGFITNLSLMTTGMALLGSAAFKLRAAAVGTKQLLGLLTGSELFKGLSTGFTGKAMTAGITTATTNVGAFGGALHSAGIVGGKAIGTIARLATGLPGILIGTGLIGVKLWADQFYEASTAADVFSTSLAKVDPENIISLNNALSGISISGKNEFWSKGEFVKSVQPFKNGVDDYRSAIDALLAAEKSASSGGWDKDNWLTSWGFEMNQWGARNGQALWDEVEAMQLVDKGIQNLVDSGNGDRALSLVRKMHGNLDQLKYTLGSSEGASIKELLENTFATAGIEMNDVNLYRFLNGQLKELSDTVAGFPESDKITDMLFGGDVEAAGKFANAIDETAAAFIDFGAALEKGMKDADGNELKNFSLANYTNELRDNMKAQSAWRDNMTTVSKYASSGLLQHLAELGPAAAPMLQALADELGSGVTTSLDTLEEAFESKMVGFGNDLAVAMANQTWAKNMLGSEQLAANLVNELGDGKMSQLYDAAQGVGRDVVENVMQGLTRGDVDFNEALRILLSNQEVAPTIKWDEMAIDGEKAQGVIDRAFGALSAKLKVEVDGKTTVAELKEKLNDPTLNKLKIDGELTLTEAYAKSREFQVWAAEQNIEMLLGANDLPGRLSTAALVAYINDQEVAVEINALPQPAENAVYEIVQLADGQRGYIQVDAENKLARDKIYQVDELTGEVREIQINGENQEAINAILKVRDKANATPAKITVTALDMASGSIDWIARNRSTTVTVNYAAAGAPSLQSHGVPYLPANPLLKRAFGGVVEYYAHGGVREDHRPQIAPAGAERRWAEPETGGEAYIPFAKDRRKRAEGILATVADRFGYALTSANNVAQFANGGTYELQRSVSYGRLNNNIQGSNGQAKRELNVHIHNPIEKNWAKDAWERIQELGGALDV